MRLLKWSYQKEFEFGRAIKTVIKIDITIATIKVFSAPFC